MCLVCRIGVHVNVCEVKSVVAFKLIPIVIPNGASRSTSFKMHLKPGLFNGNFSALIRVSRVDIVFCNLVITS